MSSVKTAYVPRFDSQWGSSQRDEPQPDQTEPPSQCQRGKRGNKRARLGEKPRFVLKVKLPQFSARTTSRKKAAKEDQTPGRWPFEPAANTPVNGGVERRGAGADLDSVGGDVFFFSQRPTRKATNKKDMAKLAVLRTISKMLEENQLIRQRLITLSQAP